MSDEIFSLMAPAHRESPNGSFIVTRYANGINCKLASGEPNDFIIVYYINGDIYMGSDPLIEDGSCYFYLAEGGFFFGEVRFGRAHGQGIFWKDQDQFYYEGSFEDGEINGQGELVLQQKVFDVKFNSNELVETVEIPLADWKKRTSIECSFTERISSFKEELEYLSVQTHPLKCKLKHYLQSRYEWRKVFRHSKGEVEEHKTHSFIGITSIIGSNGAHYHGMVESGQINGIGFSVSPSADSFLAGFYKEKQLHYFGVCHFDQSVYIGGFEKGKYSGPGLYYDSLTLQYNIGTFLDGIPDRVVHKGSGKLNASYFFLSHRSLDKLSFIVGKGSVASHSSKFPSPFKSRENRKKDVTQTESGDLFESMVSNFFIVPANREEYVFGDLYQPTLNGGLIAEKATPKEDVRFESSVITKEISELKHEVHFADKIIDYKKRKSRSDAQPKIETKSIVQQFVSEVKPDDGESEMIQLEVSEAAEIEDMSLESPRQLKVIEPVEINQKSFEKETKINDEMKTQVVPLKMQDISEVATTIAENPVQEKIIYPRTKVTREVNTAQPPVNATELEATVKESKDLAIAIIPENEPELGNDLESEYGSNFFFEEMPDIFFEAHDWNVERPPPKIDESVPRIRLETLK